MNTKPLLILGALLSFLFTGAAEPAIFSNKGKYGLTDPQTGKIILKAKYDSIYPFREKYALIRKGGKFGLVNLKGEEYLPCKYVDILFPVASTSNGKDFFFVSRNGKAYFLESTANYYSTPYYQVFYGPDGKWYGLESGNRWVILEGPGYVRNAYFKDNKPQIEKIADGFTLFNQRLYGPDREVLAENVDNAEIIKVGGEEYIKCDNKLIEPKTRIVWSKNSDGLDGIYTAASGNRDYLLYIQNQRMYNLYRYDIGYTALFAAKDCETGLWALLGGSGNVLPFKFDNIAINKNAGTLHGSDFWIVTLKSKSPVFQNELETFAEILRNENKNFVIVAENSMGRSLFGNTGAELVHNTLDKVYLEDNFIYVESGGNKSIMGMNGAMDLSGYDTVWRAKGDNMFSSDIIVQKNDKIGLYSEGKGEIIPPLYDSLGRRSGGYIFVYDGDLVGMYDNNGRKILDPKYLSIKIGAKYMEDRNYFFVKNPNGTAMIVDHNGRTVLSAGLIDGVDFLSGDEGVWCKVYKNGRMGILNLSNFKITVPCAYEDNIFFGDGKWPNRRIGVYKSSPGRELIEIWTMGGRKIASKAFSSSAKYTMKHYLESQLNASFYY